MDTLSSHMEVKLDIREKRSDWLPLRVSWMFFFAVVGGIQSDRVKNKQQWDQWD